MKPSNIFTAILASGLLVACATEPAIKDEPADAISQVQKTVEDKAELAQEIAQIEESKKLLLAKWEGPYQGVPSFDKVSPIGLIAAFDDAMATNLAEIEAITSNPAPATFENTIVALEAAGSDLTRLYSYYGIWVSNNSNPEIRAIQAEMAPKLSAFSSKITQNNKLFKRVFAVYNGPEMKSLSSDKQRLVELVYNGFASNGATLSGKDKKRYAEINQELAKLYTKFSNNVLADEESYVVYLDKSQIGGLPESLVVAAAAAAEQRGQPGKYAITNTRSSMSPFLTYSTQRDLRKVVWNNYYNRGDNGDQFDNNEIIKKILKLRHERVGLQGYDNYASWRLEERMAKTPENAMALMESIWPAATARAEEEVADMLTFGSRADGINKIEPWDYRYYAEKVRKEKYDLDSDEVKQYLQIDKLRDAMFYVADRIFNYTFEPVPEGSVPVFHEDVKVWEVKDKTTGKHIGLWYLDPFARTGKRSGAWATWYRPHTTFQGTTNVLSSNNSNFIKAPEGQPTLISWDDASTYFHEFGHALHFLASNVDYPTLNGGVRDYTEFQSQLLERWLATDEVINTYLVHHETGKPMPAELVAKIKSAATFNEGFAVTEYLASAIVDMKYHTMDPTNIDPDTFERETLKAMNMPEQIVMRHRSPHFGHVFSGEGYAASYYGYVWAEVLTSDASEAFTETEDGFYDDEVAQKLVEHLFAPRNSIDPAEAYRAFRGRDADPRAYMRDKGFPVEDEE